MPQNLSKQEQQNQNQAIFNAIALKYDLMNKITSLGMEQFWKRKAVQCLNAVNAESVVLDLCGGTGDLTNLALKRYKTGSYIVYDLNRAMLSAGKAKIPQNFRPNVQYMEGDAMCLPFAAASINKVMICFGLRNVPDMQGCLNEISRVLKPGGQLVCVEFALPVNRFLRWGYNIYMAVFVRFVSTLITGKKATYNYLKNSIANFATPAKVQQAISNAGLENQRRIKLFCGVGYIYNAIKS